MHFLFVRVCEVHHTKAMELAKQRREGAEQNNNKKQE